MLVVVVCQFKNFSSACEVNSCVVTKSLVSAWQCSGSYVAKPRPDAGWDKVKGQGLSHHPDAGLQMIETAGGSSPHLQVPPVVHQAAALLVPVVAAVVAAPAGLQALVLVIRPAAEVAIEAMSTETAHELDDLACW